MNGADDRARALQAPDPGNITALSTRLLTVPLPRPWGLDVRTHHYIEVRVETDSGAHGTGFTWTPTIGAHSVQAMLDHDIREFVLGRPAAADALWQELWEHLHEAGSGGVTTIAMAGLDLALWDALATARGESVTALASSRTGTTPRQSVEVYGSGVNRHYPLADLVGQAGRWRERGYALVKMKVGGRPLPDDLARVAAVREVIGPEIGLAIDANQLWSVEEAERAIGELSAFDLRWVEEPVRADDLRGAAVLRARIEVPVAMGENLHTVYRFREAIDSSACDLLQPNIVRVGGITPFLAIADVAGRGGLAVHPHLLPDLSGQLALALPHEALVENVEGATFDELGMLSEPSPVVLDGPRLTRRHRTGLGLAFR